MLSLAPGYHEPLDPPYQITTFATGLAGDTSIIQTGSGWPATAQELVERHQGSILTMREASLLVPQRPLGFFAYDPQQLYRLTTHTGRVIEGTAGLALLTPRGWVSLIELEPCDCVATIAEYPELFGRGDTDAELLKLLAYLTQSGAHGDGTVPWIEDRDVRRDFEAAVEAKRDVYIEAREPDGRGVIRVSGWNGGLSRALSYLDLVDVFGVRGSDKVIPAFVFGLQRDKLRMFLTRLLTCDGAAERSGRISYRTSSSRLARQLQHLFARFGIVAALVDPGRQTSGGAELSIDSKHDVVRCIEQIGFLGAKADHAAWLRAALYDADEGSGPRRARLGPILFDRVLSIEATHVAAAYGLTMPRTRNFVAGEFIVGSDPASSY